MNQPRSWSRLVESIRRARAPQSRFYKPVCLLAAIDLADEGAIDPLNVDFDAIIERFDTYVRPHFRQRASLGWQPIWYLANDGFWSFLKEGRISGPRAMRGSYQPRTRRNVQEQFDRLVIEPSLRPQWENAEARQILRQELVLMLWRDSEASSKVFARALFDPSNNERPEAWASETDMTALQRNVSGEQDLFDALPFVASPDAQTDFAAATAAIAAAIQRLEQSPLGAQFDPDNDSLTIRKVAVGEDDEVASRTLTAQLHSEVRRKVGSFAPQARRLDNTPGWAGIGGLCERLSDLLERPTQDVPQVIGLIYSSTLELGSFLEFDRELRQSPGASADPLEAGTRRGLDDLVRTLAPWVRLFPTAQQADDATGQFLAHAPLMPTAEVTVEMARKTYVLRAGDAAVLQGLLDAARRGENVGNRAGARGVASIRNMLVAVACAAGTLYVDAIASDFATKSVLARRAGTFLAAAEAEVLAFAEGLPADFRLAIEGLLRLSAKDSVPLGEPPKLRTIRRRPEDAGG